MADKILYETVSVSESILQNIREKLTEGKVLIDGAFEQSLLEPRHIAWIKSFDPIFSELDPYSESRFTSKSIAADWERAGFVNGNYPKVPADECTVFCQKVGIIQQIARTGKVTITGAAKSIEDCAYTKYMFHQKGLVVEKNSVFVLMPFSESWSEGVWGYIKEVVEGLDGNDGGKLNCKRADDFYSPEVLMRDIYKSIFCAAVVVSDMTNKNANVFYELGIAHTLGKEVILLTQSGNDIPSDLRSMRYIQYEDNASGLTQLKLKLSKAINELLAKN